MNIKSAAITILRGFAILFGATLLGTALMTAAYLLPVNSTNKESSLSGSEMMGWAPKLSKLYEQYTSYHNQFEPDALDDSTDLIILNYTFDQSEGSVLEKAVYMFGYGRYWHGYVSVLRPIFYLIDYWDFLLINGMLQISIVVILGVLVYRKTQKLRLALAVLSSYLLLMPLAVAFSLQYSPVFYVGFLGSIFAVGCGDFLRKKDRLFLFFMILGIITCYFDFLTYPLVAWGFPICWYLAAQGNALSAAKKFFSVIFSAIGWVFGYVGMFFTKWLLLYFAYGPDSFKSNNGLAMYFTKVVEDQYKVMKETYTRFDSIYTNWRHYLFAGFVLIILAWLLWGLVTRARYRWPVKNEALAFLLITLAGPAWCLVFTGHTGIHHFFTYRVLSVSILAFILFLCECAVLEPAPAAKRGQMVRAAVSLVVCLVIGWGTTCLATENVLNIYGEEYQTIHLAADDKFTCSFTPDYGDIRQLGLCASAEEGSTGTIHVELWDDARQNVLYSTDFSVEDFIGATYAEKYIEWKLDAGEAYCMTISLVNCPSGLDFLITNDGNMPLDEYQDSNLNGQSLGSVQPLGSVTYNVVVRSVITRLYLAFLAGVYLWFVLEVVTVQSQANLRTYMR